MLKRLDKSTGRGQYHVDFTGHAPIHRSSGYRTYKFTKSQIGDILSNWGTSATWKYHSRGNTAQRKTGHHPTAKSRTTAASPILSHIRENPDEHIGRRVLYHGVGMDTFGQKALGAEAYDPYPESGPNSRMPKGKFDIVHSHYTLNVMSKNPTYDGDENNGYEVLSSIYKKLKKNGHAVISVRNLANATGGECGP